MKSLDPEYAYVSSAVGGPVSQVTLGNSATGSRVATTSSRGVRGKIEKFSRGSRKNLLGHLASISCTAFSAYKGPLIAVGLTYPSEYPEDPKLCKRHLEALHKRLKRTYGLSPASGGWVSSRGEPGTSTCSSSCPRPLGQ
jgi:hypothetical protein